MFLDLKIMTTTMKFVKGSIELESGKDYDPRSVAAKIQQKWGPLLKEYGNQ